MSDQKNITNDSTLSEPALNSNLDSSLNDTKETEIIQIPNPNPNPTKVYAKSNLGYLVLIVFLLLISGFTLLNSLKQVNRNQPFTAFIDNTQKALAGPVDLAKEKELALKLLENKYIGTLPSAEKMQQGELQGLVASVGDKYTTYFSCSDFQKFQDDLNQNFEGIGASFRQNEDYIALDNTLDGSPASKSGIKKGDILVSINGQNVDDFSFSKVIDAIRGQAGTTVKLVVDRPNSSVIDKDTLYTQFTFDINREKIHQDAVTLEDKNDIAWIKVSTFSQELDSQMAVIASQIKSNPKYKYIVLDLQQNGGGLLDQAVELSSYFLKPNSVVVQEQGKAGKSSQSSVQKDSSLTNYPLLVAVDGNTASASEITAGALQDAGVAQIIGRKTFGKGVVQEINSLSGCNKIKITVAEWLTPKGTAINEKGINPDIRIKRGENLEDKVKQFFSNK